MGGGGGAEGRGGVTIDVLGVPNYIMVQIIAKVPGGTQTWEESGGGAKLREGGGGG